MKTHASLTKIENTFVAAKNPEFLEPRRRPERPSGIGLPEKTNNFRLNFANTEFSNETNAFF